MSPDLASTVGLTLRVGLTAIVVSLVPGVLLAYLLARRRFAGRAVVQTIVALPLVLPPVAVGLILLRALSRRSWIGAALEGAGIPFLFTWRAAACASAVMSFPLLVRSAQQAFEETPVRCEQVARTLGAGPVRTFWQVTLPLARRGIAYGALLAFLRALGEFGATSLVAGNFPGRTQTLSLGIYDAIVSSRDQRAFLLAGISVGVSLVAVFLAERYLRAAHDGADR
jgi:molybdate transport system permease protein